MEKTSRDKLSEALSGLGKGISTNDLAGICVKVNSEMKKYRREHRGGEHQMTDAYLPVSAYGQFSRNIFGRAR